MKNTSGYTNIKRQKVLKDSLKGFKTPKVNLKKKRLCLRCGKTFLSKGAYNRVCEKCSLTNERVASNTYSVSSIPNTSSDSRKHFYELN